MAIVMEVYWTIIVPREDEIKHCVLALPGRAGSGEEICLAYARNARLENTAYIGVTPKEFQWYPQPYSSMDQDEAVEGLTEARLTIENIVHKIKTKYGIEKRQIALTGFSAGGVMAIHTAAHSREEFAAVVCHSGAILEPEQLPDCNHPKMPIVLIHNKDDQCFDWYERYLPMKNSLLERNYKVYSLERSRGDHRVFQHDFVQSGIFLSKRLKQRKTWKHPNKNWKILKRDRILRCIPPEINYTTEA